MEHFLPWYHFTTVMWHFLPWYHSTTVIEHFLPWFHLTTVMEHFLPWHHLTTVMQHFLPWYNFTAVMEHFPLISFSCCHYEDHYEHNLLSIPTNDLQELLQLILEENSFKFNERHLIQTHDVAMGAKTSVAFSVIFMADLEKRLLIVSPYKPCGLEEIYWSHLFTVGNFNERSLQFCWIREHLPPYNQVYLQNVIQTHCFSWYWGFQRTSPFNSSNSWLVNTF